MKVSSESIAAWQHLSLAGMVEGQYTGIITLTITEPFGYVAGVNMPAAPIGRNAVYGLGPSAGGTNSVATYEVRISSVLPARNVITLGKPVNSGNLYNSFSPFGGVLTHDEAWNIDTKHDDGVSQTGKIRGRFIGNANTAYWKNEDGTGATQSGSCLVYFADTTYRCMLGWIFGPL